MASENTYNAFRLLKQFNMLKSIKTDILEIQSTMNDSPNYNPDWDDIFFDIDSALYDAKENLTIIMNAIAKAN